jgi:uncharacterized damage-inducible protein DinB
MQVRDPGEFVNYFDKIHQRTMRVVRSIPPDRVDWTFREGKFTLGDLARHIATANRYIFLEVVKNGRSTYAGCGRELAETLDEIVSFADRLHTEGVEILSGLRSEDLERKCTTPDGASITSWKWLRSMVEHEVHHRGQIYTYLSILEVSTPPLYGLTSEQVRDRSARD